ncbi:MAG: hypothetical protein H0T79_10465 [Deltaproteobacteria bacterium]|nr:hypothetical protein [Deltaproteobacteria bacterium]
MSNERTRDRGNLFQNAQKQKPSQPDFQGDCTINGTAYEIRGWRRNEQMTVGLAPPRGDRNTYPPDVFKGALDAAPPKPTRGKAAAAAKDAPPTPAWFGDIVSDEAAYKITAFEKQGKSGLYYTLNFERLEKPTPSERKSSWDTDDDELDA